MQENLKKRSGLLSKASRSFNNVKIRYKTFGFGKKITCKRRRVSL